MRTLRYCSSLYRPALFTTANIQECQHKLTFLLRLLLLLPRPMQTTRFQYDFRYLSRYKWTGQKAVTQMFRWILVRGPEACMYVACPSVEIDTNWKRKRNEWKKEWCRSSGNYLKTAFHPSRNWFSISAIKRGKMWNEFWKQGKRYILKLIQSVFDFRRRAEYPKGGEQRHLLALCSRWKSLFPWLFFLPLDPRLFS